MLMDSIQYLSGADFLYDISASVLSTPNDGDVVGRLAVTRNMTVKADTDYLVVTAHVWPTTEATFKVWKNTNDFEGAGSPVIAPEMVFTVDSGGTVTIATSPPADISLAPGDFFELEIDVADGMDEFAVTFKAVAA